MRKIQCETTLPCEQKVASIFMAFSRVPHYRENYEEGSFIVVPHSTRPKSWSTHCHSTWGASNKRNILRRLTCSVVRLGNDMNETCSHLLIRITQEGLLCSRNKRDFNCIIYEFTQSDNDCKVCEL